MAENRAYVKRSQKTKNYFFWAQKNGTSQKTEYEVQKICTIILTRKANFSSDKSQNKNYRTAAGH